MPLDKTVKIDDEIRGIIHTCTIEDDGKLLKLPPGQLDRKVYEKVAGVLNALGGKWTRGKQGFVFPEDVRPAFETAKDDGEVLDEKRAYEAFYTPHSLVGRLIDMADLEDGMRVLEPSIGDGRLAVAALGKIGKTGTLVGVEIREKLARELTNARIPVVCADFLTVRPAEKTDKNGAVPTSSMLANFDRVIMNPPFSRGTDIAHVTHALKFLKPGGKLVAIMAGGTPFVSNKKAQTFRDMIQSDYIGAKFHEVEEGAFKESGTNVRTVILTVEKPL